jgi:hypothetical protein
MHLKILPICLATVLFLWAPSGMKAQTTSSLLENGDSVLFVGNSKVGSEGGLQHHFRRTLAKANPSLTIETHWFGMFNRPTLADMYTDEVIERIKTGNDAVVIVQSGSTEAMQQFAELIQSNGKHMVILGAWADNPHLEESDAANFREATQSHMEQLMKFENEHNIPVVPSGLIYYDLMIDPPAWEGLREDFLFVPGSSVQNDLGTLVNVAAIYAVMTGNSPVGLPIWDPFPPALVKAIEERTWKIVQDWQQGNIHMKPVPKNLTSTQQKPQMSTEAPQWPALLAEGDQIYYVGNSFIGSEGGLENHFPRLLTQVEPSMNISTSSDIFWGRGLQSMYTEEVKEKIATGQNDIVVVTSGPTHLLHKFHDEITQAGSQMVIHMTWGRNPSINEGGLASFREQTVQIAESMKKFEEETGVPVVPCGLIFYDLIADPPPIEGLRLDWVFMVENIHQNHIGTMSNTAAHYAVMTGRSPVGLPMWDPYPPELVTAVQERVWKIVQEWKAGKINVKPLVDNNE